MQGQTATFTCNACGHVFAGQWDVISKQPTCPKCRTFGQLVDQNGNAPGARQNVVRVPHPAAGGARAPYGAQGGPVAFGNHEEKDYVEVAADVSYGQKRNAKSIINVVIMLGLGIGIVITLWVIVTSLKGNRVEEARQEREVVLDPKDFERAIEEAQKKSVGILNGLDGAEVRPSTNFDEVEDEIVANGGTRPSWNAPPTPGAPFRSHGFVVSAPDPRTGIVVKGFVMFLYYKTAEEVDAAKHEIDKYLGENTRNYGVITNPAQWFIAYMGVSHGGAVRDKVLLALRSGSPATYKQFTDRVGATLRDDLKD
ncbi:MAG: hypothetical protein K8I27_17025 [Planctomycetes bacterium]|nr:hypothetical protein [Planctomycetota bacterium]